MASKSRAAAAERAAEWYAIEVCRCVVTRRAIRTRFNRVDFFAADVVGKSRDGKTYYIQVTTGGSSSVSARKRKLEAIPWGPHDVVILLRCVKSKSRWVFVSYRYDIASMRWHSGGDIEIPQEWWGASRRGG